MNDNRKEKLLKICDVVKQESEKNVDIASIAMQSMQVGYEMGRMAQEEERSE